MFGFYLSPFDEGAVRKSEHAASYFDRLSMRGSEVKGKANEA